MGKNEAVQKTKNETKKREVTKEFIEKEKNELIQRYQDITILPEDKKKIIENFVYFLDDEELKKNGEIIPLANQFHCTEILNDIYDRFYLYTELADQTPIKGCINKKIQQC